MERTIEDLRELDGLKNGFGLEVFFDGNDNTLSVGVPWQRNIINRISVDCDEDVQYFLKSLVGMGFELGDMVSDSIYQKISWKLQKWDKFWKGEFYLILLNKKRLL